MTSLFEAKTAQQAMKIIKINKININTNYICNNSKNICLISSKGVFALGSGYLHSKQSFCIQDIKFYEYIKDKYLFLPNNK